MLAICVCGRGRSHLNLVSTKQYLEPGANNLGKKPLSVSTDGVCVLHWCLSPPDWFSDKEQYLFTVWPQASRNQHGLLQQDRAFWRNVSEWYRTTYGLHLPAVADCPRNGTTITASLSPRQPSGWRLACWNNFQGTWFESALVSEVLKIQTIISYFT